MNSIRFACLLVSITWFAAPVAVAGRFNPVLDIGDKAPAWKALPGTDGQDHSLDSIAKSQAIVIAFTCNSCPYAVDVEDRLNSLTKRFKDKDVAVVAINVNTVEEDLLPAMKTRAKEKSFAFPYLFDSSQEIAKAFGAKRTPEFFVFDGGQKLIYMGSFDDSPAGDKVTKTYVADAVEAALAGEKPEVSETVAIGCLIRFERSRRKRNR